MAMKIERDGFGFRIRLTNDRTRIFAGDTTEVQQAVYHYYTGGHSREPDARGCPLCRVIAARDAREQKHRV